MDLPLGQPRGSDLPPYHFPLCRPCGEVAKARASFVAACGVLGAFTVLVLSAWAWSRDRPPFALADVLRTMVLILVGSGAGTLVGMALVRLAGRVHPALRLGNRVSDAVDLRFESYQAGYLPSDYRCFFRFTNQAYAAAFAAANAEGPGAPRPEAARADGA